MRVIDDVEWFSSEEIDDQLGNALFTFSKMTSVKDDEGVRWYRFLEKDKIDQ